MLLTPTEMERRGSSPPPSLPASAGRAASSSTTRKPWRSSPTKFWRAPATAARSISFGATLLTTDDVLPGVMDLMPMIQVEATFPDGTKLVTVHDPIRPGTRPYKMERTLGELIVPDEEVEINAGRREVMLKVLNTGDRPVQIGSHYHFFVWQ
jgi:urease subunit gamma/beta